MRESEVNWKERKKYKCGGKWLKEIEIGKKEKIERLRNKMKE